ncbi:hypothetical protein AD998_11500 [bacterium 336/3]|nr:hypothetical protein AD998_11500 [bacterium 336/3]
MISLEKGLLNGTHCPNCGTEQYTDSSHCHKCGQKHLDIRKSAWSFFKDFLDTNFNFDSKVFKTGLYLIFRPGYLTRAFIEGKRSAFLPPIRLYIFFSVFFFAGLVASVPHVNEITDEEKVERRKKDSITFANRQKRMEEDRFNVSKSKKKGKKPKTEIERDINVREIEKALQVEQVYLKLSKQSLDSSAKSKIDTAFTKDLKYLKYLREKPFDINFSFGRKSEPKANIKLIDVYTLPVDSIFKKYQITQTWQKVLFRQSIKTAKDPDGFIRDFVGSKLWWATLLMIPFMALMLKLLYIRRKRYYSEHLIYGFHFFSITLLLGIPIFYIKDEDAQGIYFGIFFLVTVIYQIISQRVVYEQGWIKTIIKAFLLQFLIFIGSIFFMIFAAIIGLLML